MRVNLSGIKGNHPLRLSIINLAIVKSTVKEKFEKHVVYIFLFLISTYLNRGS